MANVDALYPHTYKHRQSKLLQIFPPRKTLISSYFCVLYPAQYFQTVHASGTSVGKLPSEELCRQGGSLFIVSLFQGILYETY